MKEQKPRSLTADEVGRLKASKRRSSAIIVAIIAVSLVGGGLGYYYLRDTPCEIVTHDMCGFVDMTGEQCPFVEKALNDMGASEEWCSEVLAGNEELEPEQISGHFLTSLNKLIDEDIARHEASGNEPPDNLLKLMQKSNPPAWAERAEATKAREEATQSAGSDAGVQDGGAQDGSPDGSSP